MFRINTKLVVSNKSITHSRKESDAALFREMLKALILVPSARHWPIGARAQESIGIQWRLPRVDDARSARATPAPRGPFLISF